MEAPAASSPAVQLEVLEPYEPGASSATNTQPATAAESVDPQAITAVEQRGAHAEDDTQSSAPFREIEEIEPRLPDEAIDFLDTLQSGNGNARDVKDSNTPPLIQQARQTDPFSNVLTSHLAADNKPANKPEFEVILTFCKSQICQIT
jgi:hypothetical protein